MQESYPYMASKTLSVLSIDLDYILEPCINDYEELVRVGVPRFIQSSDNNAGAFERTRYFAKQIDKFAEISIENLSEIFEVFTHALKTPNKSPWVYFGHNHDSILNPLKSIVTSEDKIDLINIDHHHDIFYSPKQQEDVDNHDLVSPADWFLFLDKNELLNSYIWLSNKNSIIGESIANSTISKKLKIFTTLNDCKKFLPKKFDLIYVCCSPHWMPPKFLGYFDILKTMAETLTKKSCKVDTGFYSGNRSSRPFFDIN